jgi:hypothetical protein
VENACLACRRPWVQDSNENKHEKIIYCNSNKWDWSQQEPIGIHVPFLVTFTAMVVLIPTPIKPGKILTNIKRKWPNIERNRQLHLCTKLGRENFSIYLPLATELSHSMERMKQGLGSRYIETGFLQNSGFLQVTHLHPMMEFAGRILNPRTHYNCSKTVSNLIILSVFWTFEKE